MTEEQQLESLRFALESSKLRHTEKDMEIVRLKEQVAGNEKIIEGYQRFKRDNLKNAINRSG